MPLRYCASEMILATSNKSSSFDLTQILAKTGEDSRSSTADTFIFVKSPLIWRSKCWSLLTQAHPCLCSNA